MKIDREKVYEKYDGHCGYCGKEITLKQMQVDHIRPQYWFYNGTKNNPDDRFNVPDYEVHDLRNLMPSCARCNKWKSTLSVEQFRNEIKLQIERLNNYSSNYRLAKDYGLIQETVIEVKFYFEGYAVRKRVTEIYSIGFRNQIEGIGAR